MANMAIGSYTFEFDPPMGEWTQVLKKKSRADLETHSKNITFNWGFPDYKEIVLKWPAMPKTQWDQIYTLWTYNNGRSTYTFYPRTGSNYTVEIVDMNGTPFGPATAFEWYVDVEIRLKVIT